MRVTKECVVIKHYEAAADRIKRTAMPDRLSHLLEINRLQTKDALNILERDGFLDIEQHGQAWHIRNA